MRPLGPICVRCGRHMRLKKIGILVKETGNSEGNQVWSSDMWECPKCKHQVLLGFGQEPLTVYSQTNTEDLKEFEMFESTPW